MDNLILATQTGGILGPFAWVLGKILEIIYDGFSFLGVYNIGLCIILFTLVVRMLMFPMTIKQQKFQKLNSVMTPEIQAIQKKYKNKKDQQSQLAQQEEIRAVYDKYGTSPTGSCLQLIIQMPILFALYRVIMNIPAYVQPVKSLYVEVIHKIGNLGDFFAGASGSGAKIKGEELNKYIDAMTGYATRSNGNVKLKDGVTLQNIIDSVGGDAAEKIHDLNNFFGLDISKSPSQMFAVFGVLVLIIPVLSGLFQFLNVQISTRINNTAAMQDNPMAGSMKVMNLIMPIFSVYMCYILSTGIGIYWLAGSLIGVLQIILASLYLKKVDVNDIIEANKEKAEKKAEKRKAKNGIYREKVLEASKVNAKNVSKNSQMSAIEREEKIKKAKEAMSKKEGSLASKVNMVNEYNKRNDK